MDDASGGSPVQGDPPAEGAPASHPEQPTERSRGLNLETCYRHTRAFTGVHCTRCGRPICPDCMRPAAVAYQCPDCLSEGQRSGPPRRRARLAIGGPGRVTRVLLAVNIAMFVVEVAAGGANSLLLGASAQRLFDLGGTLGFAIAFGHQYWRLFTAMFLHAGLIHLALNMYALYLFGTLIEDAFGSLRFLAIYLVSGLLASVASFAFGPPNVVGVGASGAIFGLLGAWLVYNYRRREMRLHRANLQGAVSILVLNLILSFGLSSLIDWRAHVGGLIAGMALGFVSEGVGPRSARTAVQVGGFVAVILVGVVLTVWRVHALTTQFGSVGFGI